MIKVIIYCLIGSLFIGCASTKNNEIVYEKYKPKSKSQYIQVKKTSLTKVYVDQKIDNFFTGSIKGKIVKIAKNGKVWNYEVKGEDLTNNKLPYAKFFSTKKIAKNGDLVYAIISNNELQEFYLIKKSNIKRKSIKYKKKKHKVKKTVKRIKKHQVIGVPTVESISLD